MLEPIKKWLSDRPYDGDSGRELRQTIEREREDGSPNGELCEALCLFENGLVVAGFSGDRSENLAATWCAKHIDERPEREPQGAPIVPVGEFPTRLAQRASELLTKDQGAPQRKHVGIHDPCDEHGAELDDSDDPPSPCPRNQ